MARHCLAHGLALVCVAAVSGCSVEETPERCVGRFAKLLTASHPVNDPGFRDARVQPIFTYDITRTEGVLEYLASKNGGLKGLRATISHGASGAALDEFSNAEVPRKGAIFAADNFTLYRVKGAPGTRDETLAAGCRGRPPKARLTHIAWSAMPPEDPAGTH